MSTFTDEMTKLCSREMVFARKDADRLADMLECLAHTLAVTVSIAAQGDPKKTQELMTGVEGYLYEEASGAAGFAKLT